MMLRVALLLLVAAIVVSCVVSCATTTPQKVEKVASQAPAGNVTAVDLAAAYDANEIAADSRFKDKVFIVTGVVDDIGTDIIGNPYVTLRTKEYGSGSGVWAADVQCIFAEEAKGQLAGLQKGQHVVLKGQVGGKIINIAVENCTLAR